MRFTLSLFFFLLVTEIFSQEFQVDTSFLDPTVLENITISANRLDIPFSEDSRSITIIDQEQIKNLRINNLNELLQTVAGVDLRQRGSQGVQADLSIRGGTFEQSLILINGIRMSDPQTGHHMMNLPLDVEDIERVEIIKGPAARIYGQNAFTGAVNIVTRIPDEWGVTLAAEFGEYNQRNIYAQTSMPLGKYHQTLSAALKSSDGYRFNSDYSIANLFYQSQYAYDKGKLSLLAGIVDRDFGANGFYGSENFMDQYESVQTFLASTSLEHRIADFKIMPRVSYRRNKDNWQFLREDPEFFQNFHTSQVLTSEIQTKYTHKLGLLGIGLEHNYLTLESSNLKDESGNGDHIRNQLGFHLENRFILLNDRLDITPGILILNISDYGISVYPGLDLGYSLSTNWKSFANLGWTSRIPTFTDLYYQDSGNSGNPDLVEENAFSYELGLKYHDSHQCFQASYFNRQAKNQIDWFKENEMDKWMPDNFNNATYNGLEIQYQHSFKKVEFIKFFSVGYTFISAEFEDNDFAFSRNQLENLRHQLLAQTQLSYKKFGMNLLFKYNDRVSLEDYYTLSTNLSYSYKFAELYVRMNNLTNQIYRETNLVEMPGRWTSFGIRLKF